jgi:hypothetical protein
MTDLDPDVIAELERRSARAKKEPFPWMMVRSEQVSALLSERERLAHDLYMARPLYSRRQLEARLEAAEARLNLTPNGDSFLSGFNEGWAEACRSAAKTARAAALYSGCPEEFIADEIEQAVLALGPDGEKT